MSTTSNVYLGYYLVQDDEDDFVYVFTPEQWESEGQFGYGLCQWECETIEEARELIEQAVAVQQGRCDDYIQLVEAK